MMSEKEMRVYGTVNGKPVYSRDEYVYACRGFGTIKDDKELLAFAEKVTHGWLYAGWKRNFRTYYLGDYALDEPKYSLTDAEYSRLKELQKEAQKAYEKAENARQWKQVNVVAYADNSVEEIWRDKDGNEKRVVVIPPHGDVCY